LAQIKLGQSKVGWVISSPGQPGERPDLKKPLHRAPQVGGTYGRVVEYDPPAASSEESLNPDESLGLDGNPGQAGRGQLAENQKWRTPRRDG